MLLAAREAVVVVKELWKFENLKFLWMLGLLSCLFLRWQIISHQLWEIDV